ncbi:uncharacterized protein LOC131430303 [Malaya genurostris]|uniref:uncharacterized protein LOC131430303 n=1 Tax=Malaya genurostris TaxID=325434 RepID=UPI0026F3F8DD|nr:uncharacterized protein LOC131430303 [Malaya genurostris]
MSTLISVTFDSKQIAFCILDTRFSRGGINMDSVKIKSTSKQQFARMIALLETRPDVAKGFSKVNVAPFWNSLATELNSLGPPVRDTTGWKKVWCDYKSNLKRKLAHNSKELRATGGGPNKVIEISELEEQTIALTGLRNTIQGVQNTLSYGALSLDSRDKQNLVVDNIQELFITDNSNDNADEETTCSKPKRLKKSTLDLLEQQVAEQKKNTTKRW